MCVDLMLLPFGSVMVIGLVAGLMFTAGEPLIKKWPVAPESDSNRPFFDQGVTSSKHQTSNQTDHHHAPKW